MSGNGNGSAVVPAPEGEATRRIRDLWARTENLGAEDRIAALEAEARAISIEQELRELEDLDKLAREMRETLVVPQLHPSLGDPEGHIFDQGYDQHLMQSHLGVRPRSEQDLRVARNQIRYLVRENSFAAAAVRNRVNYGVGIGMQWSLVPIAPLTEDQLPKGLLAEANRRLQEILSENDWIRLEAESIKRGDEDGERGVRIFAGEKDDPPKIRFVEPELVGEPNGERRQNIPMGVEIEDGDARDRVAMWIRKPPPWPYDLNISNEEPRRVPLRSEPFDRVGRVQTLFWLTKNVAMNSPRGWPFMWECRDNLRRADKILEASTYVATIQASIALIRRHKRATLSQVETLTQQKRDLLLQQIRSDGSRRETHLRSVGPGAVLDYGPGFDLEAPISSVEAGKNSMLVDKELEAAAASVVQPVYMLAARVDAPFASSLVSESPAVKAFQRLQHEEIAENTKILWSCIKLEVALRKLDKRALKMLRLRADPPRVETRDYLQSVQANQIMHAARVLSTETWQQKEGLDLAVERRNLDRDDGLDGDGGVPPTTAPDSPGGRDQEQGGRPADEPARAGPAPARRERRRPEYPSIVPTSRFLAG